MNRKEMFKEIFGSFFVIFTTAVMGLVVYLHLLGLQAALLRDIAAIFIIAVFTSSAGIVLYSKMIVRYLIHGILIFGIAFAAATYMGWIYWGEPITVIQFAVLIAAIFFTVHAVVFYQTKKLADKLNEKLKERYKN